MKIVGKDWISSPLPTIYKSAANKIEDGHRDETRLFVIHIVQIVHVLSLEFGSVGKLFTCCFNNSLSSGYQVSLVCLG